MTFEQQVLERLRHLPPEKQKAVLDFMESLREKGATKKPLRSLLGLWEDFDLRISDEDISAARQEMWGNFPRDLEL
ncbi:MAG TPA: hypothetical protein VNZ56_03995 [Verrucomicrobiae bacterium]|jgi:hypothetical protein|nr:hypothetical protein [Verrucomicrobiae bacterium]